MKVELSVQKAPGSYTVKRENGKELVLDGGSFFGAEEGEFRPTELLLSAVGGCAVLDVGLILGKKRFPVDDLKVAVSGVRDENATPKRFVSIHLDFWVNPAIPIAQAEKVVELSVFKYCTVAASLDKDIKITTKVIHHEG